MLKRLAFVLAAAAALAGNPAGAAAAATCAAEDFGKAVDQAGATLRAFNLANAPKLQAKLGELGRKKGWSDEEREGKARDYLQDERISALDETANDLLVKIDTLGRPPEKAPADCAKLDDLKAAGVELLAVMKTKAAYTMAKLDAGLGRGEAPPPAPKVAAAKPHPEPKPAAAKDPAPSKGDRRAAAARTAPDAGTDAAKPGAPPSKAPDTSSWTTTSELDPAIGPTARPPPSDGAYPPDAPPPGEPYAPSDEGYTIDEIRDVTRGFFGTISTSLASLIEQAFSSLGRPTAYVLGSEGGGAFLAGIRYGSGKLFLHRGNQSKVYWQGPSLGYDLGAEGSRTMFLIYSLREPEGLFRRFTGVDGSAYLVGGVGVTLLKGGAVIMAPIRSGLGLRLGANIGYIRFTPEPSWNPF